MTDDGDLQQRLRELFLTELADAVALLNAGLIRLEEDNDASAVRALIAELFRTAHSVKGAAMSAGIGEAVDVGRRLEAEFSRLRDDGAAIDSATVQNLLTDVDALEAVAEQLGGTGAGDDPADGDPGTAAVPDDSSTDPTDGGTSGRSPAPDGAATAALRDPHSVRIGVAQVDDLVGRAGDLLATVGRVHDLAATLSTVSEERAAGVPPDVAQTIDRLARSAATVARDVSRVSDGLTSAVERLTLQPFVESCSGFDRVVRDLARTFGKQARLVVTGGQIEVDRAVAAMLREPLLHLLRNAVDHGIDMPEQRQAAGKPAVGTVTISVRQRGGRLEVDVADDGRGVDRTALRRVADAQSIDAGMEGEDELAIAFQAGVSTAAEVTDVSGHGVGLDVVRARLEAIGGTATIRSTAGAGTTVTLTSPVNLALMRVMMVRLAGEVLALPVAPVERVISTTSAALQRLGGHTLATVDDDTWPVISMADLLGMPSDGVPRHLILVRVGDKAAALGVDEMLHDREVVVTPVPHRLAGVRELLGITILPGGRPALVLNPATSVPQGVDATTPERAPSMTHSTGSRRVLVAEDTMTTRVLQQRILEGAGYEVTTAVDGAQAWELLQRDRTDLVITDVNMPNMDGIALCQAIRGSPALAELPVVLVTSLGSEDDRRRGVAAGADAYIVKAQFSPDRLLETVARFL